MSPAPGLQPEQFITTGGEMAELIRSKDWSKTPLGPIESWSQALRTMVSLLLSNRFPMLLWWGPEYIQLYNDSYRPIPGSKHPQSLGQPGSECWSEIWHIIGPLIDTPFRGGPATWMEDIQLEINRHGFFEETHFTIAYSPVPDQEAATGIGGVLATVHEITEKVIGERRIAVLRDLGSRAVEAKSAEAACALAAETLARHSKDIPFALLYLIDPDRRHARLAGAAHISIGTRASPVSIDLTEPSESQGVWPLAETLNTEILRIVDGLESRFGVALPAEPWSDRPKRAVVLPIRSNIAHHLAGFLVAGISSRLKFDRSYQSFVELAATQIANAIASARAYEEERKRAESLAELDRAKTAFFSNVSHEFRTPLTLMLSPIEDLLTKSESELPAEAKRELELVNRNAYRLLRLVNTLLDFSRIEAGRAQATYEPTDLAALTTDLASVFRAATERAGLELIVDCPKLSQPVFVDRDMWEKIVLNLISNAFKFTFKGGIKVRLREVNEDENGGIAELQIHDTGVGIPPDEMPHLFERFHRIESTRSRTHEGSGIGLALVQELVKLHGGSVRAESVFGNGTTLTVSIPMGTAHLASDRIGAERRLASTSTGAAPFVEEALRWLPQPDDASSTFKVQEPAPDRIGGSRFAEEDFTFALERVPESKIQSLSPTEIRDLKSKILVVDDNADMRQYLTRILSERYEVHAVANGKAALDAVHERIPDLILSDIMMPELDGFGLLSALRSEERTAMLPVVLLSARAGEESRVEGMEAGADDYLIKPFSARELLARVSARLEIARIRREADRRKDDFLAMLGHELRNPLGIISNGIQLLRRIGALEPPLQEVQQMIERQVSHTSRLLDDLLDVSRIARGKLQLETSRQRLDEVVRQTLADHQSLFEDRKIRLEVDVPELPIHVIADSVRIAQAFGNLLSNAAKFSEPNGVVSVKLTSEGDRFAVLTVRDTGMGIEREMLGRIFETFIQADRSLERSRGGLGLGLALVKGIVELHNGRVTVTSDGPGSGSEFTIRLPLEKSQPSEKPASIAADVSTRTYRILIIEDNRLAARSTRLLLEQFGHTVEVAHDGVSGLEVACRFRPEVILCDIGLPGIDGYGVGSSLHQQIEQDGAYLIAVSGYAHDEARAREAGFSAHLTKPLKFDKLQELLRALGSNPRHPFIGGETEPVRAARRVN